MYECMRCGERVKDREGLEATASPTLFRGLCAGCASRRKEKGQRATKANRWSYFHKVEVPDAQA